MFSPGIAAIKNSNGTRLCGARTDNPQEQEENMKRLIAMLMVLVFVGVGVAFAADSVTYETKQGNVTFNHKTHQEKLKDCAKCHQEMGGPTKCGDCHKK